MNQFERIVLGPAQSNLTIFYAHGAGAGNQHEFNQYFCLKLSELGYRVVSFNFPYMQKMYDENKRRPPDKLPKLLEHFRNEIALETKQNPKFQEAILMGKSMGGRVASLIASSEVKHKLKALVVLGYPFMPGGKLDKFESRTEHFTELSTPTLILQGERDIFGSKAFFLSNKLKMEFISDKVELMWLQDGDHSFKPRKSSGTTESRNLETALKQIIDFIQNE